MPITLGSNIASLRGQQALNKATEELRSTYERLSSGQRINRASDDAAGLSIADNLNADSRIYSQGVRNLNDGISLLNIADSAVENLSSIISRLQELAEQSANGVYGSRQREALNDEAQSLKAEFLRIQQSTSFNGVSLLNGELSQLTLQAGNGSAAILDVGVGGMTGDGTFGTAVVSASDSGSANTTLRDLNGDGVLDLVSQNFTADTISVNIGLENGSFSSATNYSVDANSTKFALADFNNDGVFDLVTSNAGNNSISMRLGNSDGTFGSSTTTSVGAHIGVVDVADLNGDGNLDLVGASTGTSILVLMGNGNGSFQTSNLAVGAATTYVTLADLDGDGITDIASRDNNVTANINIYRGNGNGTFNTSPISTFSTGTTNVSNMTAVDFNNDGQLDLGFNSRTEGFRVFMNQGNASFGGAIIGTSGAANNNRLAFADYNGDGFADIAVGHATGSAVFLNNGNGGFGSATTYNSGVASDLGMTSGDLNNDGVVDLISHSGTSVYANLGNVRDGVAPLLDFSLKTITGAKEALSMFKTKGTLLSRQRGEIGAYQARVSVASNVLTSARENFLSAESRIRDADIAQESSEMIRNKILQSAASAVLAQANRQPALALKVLAR